MASELMVRLPARLWTLDDVADLAAHSPDLRYEAYMGTLWVMPPGDSDHQGILTRLAFWLLQGGLAPAEVLMGVGLRVSDADGGIGRCPDLVVRRTPLAGADSAVWLDPPEVRLVVEVVSPASAATDRHIKPGEYAAAAIPEFWLIERDDVAGPVVYMFALAAPESGAPGYVLQQQIPLDDLLSGPVPAM